jgi:S-adenosylmethionine hydrolase
MSSSFVTLTTDFGVGSPYVAQLKGRILSIAPFATIVDVTHGVPPQDIRQGALILSDVACCFPETTLHLGIIDPGVGTSRQVVVVGWDEPTSIASPTNYVCQKLRQCSRHAPHDAAAARRR